MLLDAIQAYGRGGPVGAEVVVGVAVGEAVGGRVQPLPSASLNSHVKSHSPSFGLPGPKIASHNPKLFIAMQVVVYDGSSVHIREPTGDCVGLCDVGDGLGNGDGDELGDILGNRVGVDVVGAVEVGARKGDTVGEAVGGLVQPLPSASVYPHVKSHLPDKTSPGRKKDRQYPNMVERSAQG